MRDRGDHDRAICVITMGGTRNYRRIAAFGDTWGRPRYAWRALLIRWVAGARLRGTEKRKRRYCAAYEALRLFRSGWLVAIAPVSGPLVARAVVGPSLARGVPELSPRNLIAPAEVPLLAVALTGEAIGTSRLRTEARQNATDGCGATT